MTPAILHDSCKDFRLEEYKALRAEVLALLETLRTLERNVIVAIAVVWGWLFEKHTDVATLMPKKGVLIILAWWIPALFVFLCGWRVFGITRFFGEFKDYLTTVESAFWMEGSPKGWQHFTAELKKGKRKLLKLKSISDGTTAFWITLFAMTVVVAAIQTFRKG
jgi:hypothetical protein